ncbi:MAG: hypothetical protein ACOC2C_01560 [Cyclonatronaceae bacterium]
MIEGKLLRIALRMRWRAITASGWGLAGLAGALFGLLTAVVYGAALAFLLNNPAQLPAQLPANIRELLLTAIAGSISLIFGLKNVIPSVKQKINIIPATAPLSALRRTLAQLIADFTTPLFLSLFVFLSVFSFALDSFPLHEAVYLWSSFFTFWIFGQVVLTLIHQYPVSKLLYAPLPLFALPLLLPAGALPSAGQSWTLAGITAFALVYLWLLESCSGRRAGNSGRTRASDVQKMLGLLSIKEKKLRSLLLTALGIKLAFGLYWFVLQEERIPDSDTSALAVIYQALLISPVVASNYFIANIWGFTPALWLRISASPAGLRRWFRIFWKLSKLPLLLEWGMGLGLYIMFTETFSATTAGLGLIVFPLLLFSAFLASLWWPKKVASVMSFSGGNSVSVRASIVLLLHVLVVFMLPLHPLLALGPAAFIVAQFWAWQHTRRSYAGNSPRIFKKLR